MEVDSVFMVRANLSAEQKRGKSFDWELSFQFDCCGIRIRMWAGPPQQEKPLGIPNLSYSYQTRYFRNQSWTE